MGKITSYNALTTTQPDDLLVIVDVHDTSMAATGTDKKITVSNLLSPALQSANNLSDVASASTARTNLGLGSAATQASSAFAPFLPWQFRPESYSGKGDGIMISDAIMSSSVTPTHISFTASTPFTSTAVDGGKAIIVMGAGAAGAPLLTTISTVTDSGHAVLTAGASTTVNGTGCIFGTDNTAAIKSAQSAAVTYGQANRQYAEVVFQPSMYVVAGAATVGGATAGNAIFPLPVIAPSSTAKLTLAFKGLQSDAGSLMHWLQPAPEAAGAVLAVLRLDGTVDATYGPASVIGGPYHGYGGVTSLFSNLQPVIDNLSILVPANSTFSGFDFFGCAEAVVTTARVLPMAIVPAGGAWPQQANGSITNAPQFGLRMPDVNNNDRCDVGQFSAEGMCYGIMPSEHTTVNSVRTINCIIGIQAYASSNTPHGAHIHYASVEACGQAAGIYVTAGGAVKLTIDQLDYEGPTTDLLYDPSNLYEGQISFRNAGTGYAPIAVNGGALARLINLDQLSGPVASPQAPPASGSAWQNAYYRDAWITLSATTITAVKIDAVTQNIPASATTYSFTLPSGHSYTPTYTGTLTHTVSLL